MQVHLGNNIFLSEERLQWLSLSKSDGLFCRDVARLLWDPSELVNRSVTGRASRRFAKEKLPPKRALTPTKLAAAKSKLL